MTDKSELTEVEPASNLEGKDTRLENGQFKPGVSGNPSGAGGFGDHPENRSNGSWKKEDTPRGRLEKLLNSTSREEFRAQLEQNKVDFSQSLGQVMDSALLNEVFIIDQDHPENVRVDFDKMIKLHEFVYGKKSESDLNVKAEEGVPIIRGFVIPHLPAGFIDNDIETQLKEQQ